MAYYGAKTAEIIEFMNAHCEMGMDACCQLMVQELACVRDEHDARLWYADLVRRGRAQGVITKRPPGRPKGALGRPEGSRTRQIRLVSKMQAVNELGVGITAFDVLAKEPQFPELITLRGRAYYDAAELEQYKRRKIQHHAKCLEALTGRPASSACELGEAE